MLPVRYQVKDGVYMNYGEEYAAKCKGISKKKGAQAIEQLSEGPVRFESVGFGFR